MKTTIKKGNSSLTSRFAIGKLVLTAYSKYIVILMHETLSLSNAPGKNLSKYWEK